MITPKKLKIKSSLLQTPKTRTSFKFRKRRKFNSKKKKIKSLSPSHSDFLVKTKSKRSVPSSENYISNTENYSKCIESFSRELPDLPIVIKTASETMNDILEHNSQESQSQWGSSKNLQSFTKNDQIKEN